MQKIQIFCVILVSTCIDGAESLIQKKSVIRAVLSKHPEKNNERHKIKPENTHFLSVFDQKHKQLKVYLWYFVMEQQAHSDKTLTYKFVKNSVFSKQEAKSLQIDFLCKKD